MLFVFSLTKDVLDPQPNRVTAVCRIEEDTPNKLVMAMLYLVYSSNSVLMFEYHIFPEIHARTRPASPLMPLIIVPRTRDWVLKTPDESIYSTRVSNFFLE
jgi:hypothetical protein